MAALDTTSNSREWAHCFRMSPKWVVFSLGFMIFCLAIPIGGTIAIMFLAAPGEKLQCIAVVWCTSACWGPFFAMGAYIFVAARRYRLFLGDDALCEQGVFRERIIALADIQQVRWNPLIDGGMIEARDSAGKISVTLMLLRSADRPQVIAWFRDCVPADQQWGWDVFEDWILPSPAARRRHLLWQTAGYGIGAVVLLIIWLTGLLSDQFILGLLFSFAIGQVGRWFMTA